MCVCDFWFTKLFLGLLGVLVRKPLPSVTCDLIIEKQCQTILPFPCFNFYENDHSGIIWQSVSGHQGNGKFSPACGLHQPYKNDTLNRYCEAAHRHHLNIYIILRRNIYFPTWLTNFIHVLGYNRLYFSRLYFQIQIGEGALPIS